MHNCRPQMWSSSQRGTWAEERRHLAFCAPETFVGSNFRTQLAGPAVSTRSRLERHTAYFLFWITGKRWKSSLPLKIDSLAWHSNGVEIRRCVVGRSCLAFYAVCFWAPPTRVRQRSACSRTHSSSSVPPSL